jgi:phosphoglycerol transferase MdoB-like AlkP superfamily enzyme
MNTLKVFWSEIWRAERPWVVLRMLCALLWAGELFWIQHLAFADVPWVRFPMLVQGFRFYLDLVVALALVLLLRRRYVAPLLALNVAALAIIGTYQLNFHRPLMPVRAYAQWREGWSLHQAVWELVPWRVMAVLLVAAGLKGYLLLKSGAYTVSLPFRRRTWACVALAYLVPVTGLQFTNLRLNIDPNGGMGRAVFAYGFTLPWTCDLAANRNLEKHAERAKEFLTHHYDRITPLESPLPLQDRIVVLQLESLGGHALDASQSGQWVMPFLRELKTQSMYFRLVAFHRNGSCDMDFTATTFTEPYPGLVPYRLPGLTYTNAMPGFLKQYGFKTYFFHGNTALFYDRGLVLEKLGFDQLIFREQLASLHLPASVIGIRDAEILRLMAKAIQAETRGYFFTITLDTHAPFQALKPQEMEVFPDPVNPPQRYLNALQHLDRCLREFIGQLPAGTTVVMYGDHTTSMDAPEFKSDVVAGKEYVACLIYQKGSNLAEFQKTREQPVATDGSLNLLDVMSYLRQSIAAKQWPSAGSTAVTRAAVK